MGARERRGRDCRKREEYVQRSCGVKEAGESEELNASIGRLLEMRAERRQEGVRTDAAWFFQPHWVC